jgi:hypothetical protein
VIEELNVNNENIKKHRKCRSGCGGMPIIPAVRKLRHEDMEFEAIRDYQ